MHRLFVAIRPPEHIRDLLIDTMEGLDAARWQGDEQLHVTLRYIGEVETPMANDIAAVLESISTPPFDLALEGVGTFDKRGRVHTLWAGLAASPELRALQRKVEQACQSAGLEPEHRRFAPHITIARLNNATGPLDPWLAAHRTLASAPWRVNEFRLYESTLGKAGAHYEAVARYALHD